MTTVTLAVDAAVFGTVGAGGVALVLSLALVLGVRGGGRVKLTASPATYLAFVASTSFAAAGQMWTQPEQLAHAVIGLLGG
ncbi:hypothetical protein [Streptomyces zhihengii]|uniref:Uncharacterized protein n=1 Tax=Streptomyces zhihengii TaxID=1818004 RepID=A0ABS2UUM5_9ACTN|nr:hypothetical protein [Streptomyces zhihengii]MBM9621014.1 hypothetical protein [Streptomyces zhihengii]